MAKIPQTVYEDREEDLHRDKVHLDYWNSKTDDIKVDLERCISDLKLYLTEEAYQQAYKTAIKKRLSYSTVYFSGLISLYRC